MKFADGIYNTFPDIQALYLYSNPTQLHRWLVQVIVRPFRKHNGYPVRCRKRIKYDQATVT